MQNIPCLLDDGTKQKLKEVAQNIPNNATIVEIGSFLGGSISYFVSQIDVNKKRTIYCVDNWKFDNISDSHLKLCEEKEPFVVQFLSNMFDNKINANIIKMDSIEASKLFKNNSIDFLFVDGCHTYPYVRDELKAWLPKMKENSVIIGHDYSSSEDIRLAVSELFNDNVGFSENRDSYIYTLGKGL